MPLEAGVEGAAAVGDARVGGDGHGNEPAAAPKSGGPMQQLIAVLAGHLDIREEDVDFRLFQDPQRGGRGRGRHDCRTGRAEDRSEELARVGLVIHNQDSQPVEALAAGAKP